MGNRLSEATAQVKHAYDLAEYVSRSINLTSAGPNLQKGLCPFHNEKTGSFMVNTTTQTYRCYGCGAYGDLLSFVQNYEHMSFIEALKSLAAERNLQIDLDNDQGEQIDFVSLRKCVRDAAIFYAKNFITKVQEGNSHVAIKQVANRGLPVNENGKYGLASGAKNKLCEHLLSLGYSADLIIQAGLANKYDDALVDFFRDRLLFIITDTQNRPIGFTGRQLYENSNTGKYVNTKETPLFHKSDVLYNLFAASKQARATKEIYVVEGQFDVRACVYAGIENTVAASGTAFTERHAQKCHSMVGKDGKVVFVFDGDKAGLKAAKHVLENIPQLQTNAYAVSMPNGIDPCDYRLQYGNVALMEHLSNNKTPLAEFVLKSLVKEANLSNATLRAQFVDQIAPLLRSVRSRSLRESLIRYVALFTQSSYESVIETVGEIKNTTVSVAPQETKSNITPDKLAIARAVKIAIEYPTLIPRLNEVAFAPFDKVISDLQSLYKHAGERLQVVPEDFDNKKLVSYIINMPELMCDPLSFHDDKVEHFEMLISYIKQKHSQEYKHKRAFKIMQALSDNGQDPKLLAQAVTQYQNREDEYF